MTEPSPPLLTIATIGGKLYSTPYSPVLTVAQVKAALQASEGFPALHQVLIYKGRNLPDHQSLKDLDIGLEAKIHMVIVNKALQKLFVRLEGRVHTLDVLPDDSVGVIKRALSRIIRRDLSDFTVFDEYRALKNESQRLEDAGVRPLSLLELRPQRRYGA